MTRYKTCEEAIPNVWKTSPMPRSLPKRPVGRPTKRKLETDFAESSDAGAKRRLLLTHVDLTHSVNVDLQTDNATSNVTVNTDLPHTSPSEVSKDLSHTSHTSQSEAKTDLPHTSHSEVTTDLPHTSQSEANTDLPHSEVTTDLQSEANTDLPSQTPKTPTIRGRYKYFNLKQKLEVVKFSKTHGIRGAANHYKIPKSTVMNWSKIDYSDTVRDKKGCLQKEGRHLSYPPELDNKICEWVLQQRDLQIAVTVDDICIYAAEIVKPIVPGFQASRNWATRFMKRHDLTLRAKTSLSQRLPADLEEKLENFNSFVTEQRMENEFDDSMIINMDETPMYFDLVHGKTINQKGEKSVLIRTTGAEKRHLTVVLAVSADGDVLPPMIIFKGKRALKFPVPKGWIVTVQEKGWMDETLMLRWVAEIYLKYTHKDRSLIVLDSFRGHLTDKVKRAFKKGNSVMAVIPGGCTSKIQPLDVSINKPFKGILRKQWNSFMRDSAKEARDAGAKVKAATKETVVSWLETAVDSITDNPRMIVKSFKVCGISNSLSGNESDLVRNDSIVMDTVHNPAYPESDDEEEFEGFSSDDLQAALDHLERD